MADAAPRSRARSRPLQADPAWPLHQAAGLSLRVPDHWQVRPERAGDLAVTGPDGQAAALLRTRALPPRAELAPWLGTDYPASESGLHQVQLLHVRALSPRVACMCFDYGSQVFRSRACAVAVRRGLTATIYIAAAAQERLRERLPLLAAILASVRADRGPDLPAAGIDLSRLLHLGLDPPPGPRPPSTAHIARKTP